MLPSGIPLVRLDWRRLSIATCSPARQGQWNDVLSLRCICGRLTFGCREHWFCGLCERCRVALDDDRKRAARLRG